MCLGSVSLELGIILPKAIPSSFYLYQSSFLDSNNPFTCSDFFLVENLSPVKCSVVLHLFSCINSLDSTWFTVLLDSLYQTKVPSAR